MTKLVFNVILLAGGMGNLAFTQIAPHSQAQAACSSRGPECGAYLRALRLPGSMRKAVYPAAQPATALTAQYTFTSLSIPAAVNGAQANGINNQGLAVGYYLDASYNTHGFVWQNGQAQTVDYPGGVATYLYGVNNDGLVIGSYVDSSYINHAVIYSIPGGVWTVLPDIANFSYNSGFGINNENVATGYADGFLGFLSWVCPINKCVYSYFTAPGANEASTLSYALNDHDMSTGYFIDVPAGAAHGFLKDKNSYVSFTADQYFTLTTGINNAGTVVGTNFVTGFIRTSGGVLSLVNVPDSVETDIYGINDLGVLCGDWFDANYNQYALIATPIISSATR